VEPGARKRQRNRRKGAPQRENLVAPIPDAALLWLIVTGIAALFRRVRRRRRSLPKQV